MAQAFRPAERPFTIIPASAAGVHEGSYIISESALVVARFVLAIDQRPTTLSQNKTTRGSIAARGSSVVCWDWPEAVTLIVARRDLLPGATATCEPPGLQHCSGVAFGPNTPELEVWFRAYRSKPQTPHCGFVCDCQSLTWTTSFLSVRPD